MVSPPQPHFGSERRGYRIKNSRNHCVLIIEDDTSISQIVATWLNGDYYDTTCVTTAEEGLEALANNRFDLIILDWMLPGSSGISFCKEYRERGGTLPILMLTGKSKQEEITSGLDTGCDDYLTKPFELRELSARVRALLRRPPQFKGTVLSAGGIILDARSYTVRRGDQEIHLMPKEFMLLEFLLRHPDKVFSPEALLDNIWNSDADTSPDAIRTYIKRVRKKIDLPGKPSLIVTIHGVGYKLVYSE
ncbi:MAG TPA: response regulator transcription factor [Candidatus Obscuribacterales bacterium]